MFGDSLFGRLELGGGADRRVVARVPELDWLMLPVFALCCLGVVMAVSVQAVGVDATTPVQAVKGQGAKVVCGLVAFAVCALTPIDWLRRHARRIYAVGLVLVLAAWLVGPDWNGAHRWISLFGHSFQPVEFARLALILVTAAAIADAAARIGSARALIAVFGPALVLAGGLALQPDLGNALLCVALGSVMAIAAGVRLRWFVLAAVPLLPVVVLAIATRGYAVGRVMAFLHDAPYQVRQSVLAISSGGLTGQGIGAGWMKMGFVPEARNDFVFAVVGEELGFVGSLFVVLCYGLVAAVGLRLVVSMRDPFCRYVVFGCTVAIVLQALVNLFVTTGMAPAKGIDLPFVSSGGTNLMACLGAVGLVGNAARADRAGSSG